MYGFEPQACLPRQGRPPSLRERGQTAAVVWEMLCVFNKFFFIDHLSVRSFEVLIA